MEELLHRTAAAVALALAALSVLAIALGGAEAAFRTFVPWLVRHRTPGLRRAAWMSFGRWLLLGLEFMLAADVVRTVISPTWQEVGLLGAIALIRTFLNFFLERDLAAAAREEAAGAVLPVRLEA
jgi:uncharacterized membrane protein